MNLRRSLALMVALAGLAGTTMTIASAQDPKAKPKTADDKKADEKKADDKKAAKAGGKIEIYEGKKGWRFRIMNGDDKTIAMATKSYEKKDDVLKELDAIKGIVNTAKPVEVKE